MDGQIPNSGRIQELSLEVSTKVDRVPGLERKRSRLQPAGAEVNGNREGCAPLPVATAPGTDRRRCSDFEIRMASFWCAS